MTEVVKPKRRYNATRRRALAEETRRAIVEAARDRFIEWGYAGTTMEMIAQEAGVAVETVYATFRTKRAVLARVMDVAVVGDEAPVPLLEREGPRAVREARDRSEQFRIFSRTIREIMERVGPIFEVMRAAALHEAEIRALLDEYLQKRHVGMQHFVQAIVVNGPLRPGLSVEEATDVVWTVTSAEVHRLFTRDRSWSGDRYERWLRETLSTLLTPDTAPREFGNDV